MKKCSNQKKILIIDDDPDLTDIICDLLEDYHYSVTKAGSSEEAYGLMKNQTFHLIVLDINLPHSTGFELCKEIRSRSNIPIIFASARTNEQDKLTGLDIGGDDYLEKPYSLKELLSRINSLIRRTYEFTSKNQIIVFGLQNEFSLSIVNRTVTKNAVLVNLSLKEFDLLVYLAEHKGTVLKKEAILNEVWGVMCEVELSTVAVHIRWLREKLEADPSKPQLIKTVWGIGYCLNGGVDL